MANRIELLDKTGMHIDAGDPFLLRYDGAYYLYVSGSEHEKGIRVFHSDDLIHFEDKGFVVEDERLTCPYAPEAIYHDGYFYLTTSPKGNGHYLLRGTSPLGPFEFLSENIGEKIDGSFALDKDFNLRFLRASISGIVMKKVNDGEMEDRKDLVPAIGNAWTEGPNLFYRDGTYYLTYCGNHLESSAYRTYLATSRNIDFGYTVQDEPLLISTKPGFSNLGHASFFLAPDLDTVCLSYHNLEMDGRQFGKRYLNMDPLQFGEEHVSINPSIGVDVPFPRPDFETRDASKAFLKTEQGCRCPKDLESIFTAEINFSGDLQAFLGGLSIKVEPNNGIFVSDGRKEMVLRPRVNLNNHHCVRLIAGEEKSELLLDNVPLCAMGPLEGGAFLFQEGVENTSYLAFSNGKAFQRCPDFPIYFPGRLESTSLVDGTCEIVSEGKAMHLFARIASSASGTICVKEKRGQLIVPFEEADAEYADRILDLGTMAFEKEDCLHVECPDSAKLMRLLAFGELDEAKTISFFDGSKAELSLPIPNMTVEFAYDSFVEGNRWGILLNASGLSDHPSNDEPRMRGYLVGFWNDLLVVEKLEYGAKRIFDLPCPQIKVGERHVLSATSIGYAVLVHLDGELVAKVPLHGDDCYGYSGIYRNKYAYNVHISNSKAECKPTLEINPQMEETR